MALGVELDSVRNAKKLPASCPEAIQQVRSRRFRLFL